MTAEARGEKNPHRRTDCFDKTAFFCYYISKRYIKKLCTSSGVSAGWVGLRAVFLGLLYRWPVSVYDIKSPLKSLGWPLTAPDLAGSG
jgi:hypothetical protein